MLWTARHWAVLVLVSEPKELRDVSSPWREHPGMGTAGERGKGRVIHPKQVALQTLLGKELVRERARRPVRRPSRFRMLALPVAEHGVREAAEGVGRPHALIRGRTRRPGASTDQVPQR